MSAPARGPESVDAPTITDYGFVSSCHSAALVSKDGSIDWCCLPRFDSGSTFGRLLDREKGGFCRIAPATDDFDSSRRYRGDSLVLETTFDALGADVHLTDCFVVDQAQTDVRQRRLLRVVDGVRGSIEMRFVLAPRFDYGSVQPWFRQRDHRVFSAVGGNDALLINGDIEFEKQRDELVATVRVGAGERLRLALTWLEPERLDEAPAVPSPDQLDEELDKTVEWWNLWAGQMDGRVADAAVRRSAVVLRGLVNATTGAVAAAPTTSLPETIGGSRNWDYRYSWIRDSHFTVRSLADLGLAEEADRFRRFVERSAAGSASSLRIAYGLGGERRLTEVELDGLEGYRHSTPVRIGNAASGQRQLDVFGILLELAWRWHQRGRSPDDDYWRFLLDLVDTVAETWTEPDHGIWEVRSEPRHFVQSKMLCWTALDRGLRLAEACLRRAPTDRWERARADVRDAVDTEGYDDARGVYRRSFGSDELDAALLLAPAFGYLDYDDDRMIRTTDAVRAELERDGLLLRYQGDDGFDDDEGAFIACSFWLTECLARQGRREDAMAVFNRTIATANDLGLFSEEHDPDTNEPLGNYPQALSHLSHITAALALEQCLS